jgi:hypothetical protein
VSGPALGPSWLGDEDAFDGTAQAAGLLGNEGPVDVDESHDAPVLLRRSERLDQKCGRAYALGAEDLADATARPAANSGQSIKIDQPGAKYIGGRLRHVTQSLQRANTKLLLDSRERPGDIAGSQRRRLVARRHVPERLEHSFPNRQRFEAYSGGQNGRKIAGLYV